jgi:uncharacterized protein (TIGR03086 family)
MTITDLGPATSRLCTVIQSVADVDLQRPTPCSAYTVGDLLDHLAGVTIAFGGAAIKSGGESSTMGPSGDASRLAADWRTSIPQRLEGLAVAWRESAAWDGMTCVGGNELPGSVVGIIALGELVIHGWDLAEATNQPFDADPDTLVPLHDLVRQAFGPGHDEARGQAFGPAVPVPSDAAILDQTLGLLGRDPKWSSRLSR